MLQDLDRGLQALERAGAGERGDSRAPKLERASREAYEAAERVNTAAAYRSVTERYRGTFYADLAQTQLDKLRAPEPSGTPRWTPGQRFRDCEASWCPWLVVVPSGNFMMGSQPREEGRDDSEGPVHRVTINKPMAVGVREVTFEEWDACHRSGGCEHDPPDRSHGRGNRPVINVSWPDAQEFVGWLSKETGKRYRLLSESEWEYVARGGATARFSWGDAPARDKANCRGCGSRWDGRQTAPVGSFEPNGFDLHDVHGNVWEWVEDCWHENYKKAPRDGSAWTRGGECARRVLRGGSWSYIPRYLRSASRFRNPASYRLSDIGFRVARMLD